MIACSPISLLFFFTIFPTSASGRRLQQEPLFPPTQSPRPAEPTFSSLPKYPLSANSQPFFPEYTYPPPSPPSSPKLPTFPANISSLVFPNAQTNSTRRRSSAKIAVAVLLPLLALLSLSVAFFLHHRRNPSSHSSSSEKDRFFPPNYPSSSSDAGTASSVSDFLYAGIIHGPHGPSGADSPGHISSPELRPLPPLSRHLRQNYGNTDERCSSEEEFYSPRGSSAGKISNSQNEFPPAAMDRLGSCSDTLSTTPSHSSSYVGSCSPPVSLPSLGTSISGTFRYVGFRPPELPPRLPRPVIHSPSNRKPLSSSTLSYPNENGSTPMSTNSTVLLNNSISPASFADKLRSANSFSAQPRPPPPPPPPLLRPGHWDFIQRRPPLSHPPVLVPPKPVEAKSTTLHSEEENCESVEKNEDTRPKLKPLHWDKLGGSSDRAMVWDQLKSSSFQVNEERIESLFVCNTNKETSKQSILAIPKQENRVVLDPKKSHNIAILLRALNITEDMVCKALLGGNTERLGAELLETILRMAPTREEEHKLRESKDDAQVMLGPAERFLKALLDIPFAFKRLDAMLYISNFESDVNFLKKSFETLELACDELRGSGIFLKLLEAVLKTGNHINIGTDRGSAQAFKLDALLKLVDVKGADGKTTLLHFVVQEMVRSEGSRPSSTTSSSSLHDDLRCRTLALQAVAGLGRELSNVKKAASMDHEVLSCYVSKLASGVSKISHVLRLNEELLPRDASNQNFRESMGGFMKKAEDEITRIQAQESVALSLVKEITEYFHGNSSREEAHPFRIFMVVRDFLSILDQVCKEIGRTMHCGVANSTRRLPAPVGPTFPSVSPRLRALRPVSSDDDNSVSSSSA